MWWLKLHMIFKVRPNQCRQMSVEDLSYNISRVFWHIPSVFDKVKHPSNLSSPRKEDICSLPTMLLKGYCEIPSTHTELICAQKETSNTKSLVLANDVSCKGLTEPPSVQIVSPSIKSEGVFYIYLFIQSYARIVRGNIGLKQPHGQDTHQNTTHPNSSPFPITLI